MPSRVTERINFGKIKEIIAPPNLIELQTNSYREFLQAEVPQSRSKNLGLQAVFTEVFPIESYDGKCVLDFHSYEIGEPKVDWLECLREGLTYGAPLYVTFLLKEEKGTKEEKVFMGELPLMTPQGTFVINGAERVIVSQLHRSPGLAFEATQHPNGKMLHSFRIIPDRGSWYEAQFDTSDLLYVYLDRKKRRRKFLTTTFFRALAFLDGESKESKAKDAPLRGTDEEILKLFYEVEEFSVKEAEKRDDLANKGGDSRILTKADLVAATKYLLRLKKGEGSLDDIDHLGSRRVRTVGELLANQCRVGLARTERLVKERMTLFDQGIESMSPQKLINPKALSAVIRDFFGSSQLSQFMDQINPLAELTHKRRLSALGPGGLSRDRAGFEVRDVHPSHYGRICPVETPEGPNIGLIASLATFARINDFGFLETPYRRVETGKVSSHIDYLTADREESFVIAQANSPISDRGQFGTDRVVCRGKGDFIDVEPARVDYMDVSPKQLVSVAASLIPFLEHDDANRALMGSNMQRQAVPLLCTEAPLVATGLEERVARDSRAVIVAEEAGKVASVNGNQIIITEDGKLPETKKRIKHDPEKGLWVYQVRKFMRSNAATCINQKILVRKGDSVKKGQVIADGPCTRNGELALGRNVLVAFMPWNDYNFEDAILITEPIVKDHLVTSIHIDEFEVAARDTKLGPEEITRDIPNLGDEALKNLGPDGVIRIGAEVKPGDILVGKITPKSETELAPEERLLRAIFGEKAADVKDTSLKVPSGTYGIVMDVKVSAKKESEKASAKVAPGEVKKHAKQIEEEYKSKTEELREQLTEALSNILLGEKIPLDVVNSETGEIIIPANRKITKTLLRKLAQVYDRIEIDPSPIRNKINEIIGSFKKKFDDLQMQHDEEMERVEAGDEVDTGVIKSVKVYIASKRKLSVGDKMAGRHGNKGVVAKIVPEEDMPFLADGTAVDIVLNPLGVPSRMNVGQVLETHLGWAARLLGMRFATPVFDGIKEKEIRGYLKQAALPEHGKPRLFDGRTGEPFDQEIVVGYIYMMKLGHLVADKIHARAVGPYSLVTEQPLGGQAQYGGQRLGEMEVWAMQAYGAAYTLQELLTVKSDDVAGRTRIYESIVKGEGLLEPGIPESFNVLIKEMQSLGLDVKVGSQAPTFMESVA